MYVIFSIGLANSDNGVSGIGGSEDLRIMAITMIPMTAMTMTSAAMILITDEQHQKTCNYFSHYISFSSPTTAGLAHD